MVKRTNTEKMAENYFVQTRLDRGLTESAYLFRGLGWDRNTFAGVKNRYDVVAGAGRAWADSESRRFKSDLGLTYTVQDDVIEGPGGEDSFGGLRATLDFVQSITA